MNVGPLGGIPASAAGSPLAQTKGSDAERAQQDNTASERRIESDRQAEHASGVGETDGEDHETAERDADGRRLWEESPQAPSDAAEEKKEDPQSPSSKDATGQRGNLLDLSG